MNEITLANRVQRVKPSPTLSITARVAELRALRRLLAADGLFVWVTLPRNFDGRELLRAAQERGVRYCNGELFHSNADGRHTLRLSYSTASPSRSTTSLQSARAGFV